MRARLRDLAPGSAQEATGKASGRRPARAASTPADVLFRSQRTAGNRAVARVLEGAGGDQRAGDDLAAAIASRRGAGHPLPGPTRVTMEESLGARFDDVRVHRDGPAEGLAERLGARAFTVGTEVFFGRGAFAPDTHTGRTTLVHELVHTMQQGSGGSGVGAGLRVSDPADPDERQAAQIAAVVTAGTRVDGTQGSTAAGADVQRDATGGCGCEEEDDGSDGPLSVQREAKGAPALPHRARMEQAFGEDFSDVSVTLGASSALSGVDASAVTDGTSIAFASESPAPEDVAHELAHVVQRRRNGGDGGHREYSEVGDASETEAELVASRVMRGHDAGAVDERAEALLLRRQPSALLHPEASPEVLRRYDAWVDGIYAGARRIVLANVEAVQAWRTYVMEQLTPHEMAGQVFGTGFQDLEQRAIANNAQSLLPYYAAEANPIRQELLEHQMSGEWRACTACHVSNQAWAHDSRMRDEGNPGVTPAELLTGFAGGRSFPSGGRVGAGTFRDPGEWDSLFAPAQPNRPAPVQVAPLVHTEHALPAPARRPEESMAAVRQALLAIQPHLQPLGDSGYKIIPSNLISRFGQAPVEELRTAVEDAFARRLAGYQQLLGRIVSQSIEYLEFDTLVGMLKPMATPEVGALVEDDKRRKERDELFDFVGMLLLDLLSIVVPPLAIVAGAAHIVHGMDQMSVGSDRNAATGLHSLMSPERQASGAMMMTAGALEVMGGAVQVALATAGMRAAGGGGRVVSTQRQGPITLELLENGTVRGTHAGYPGKSIVMQADGSVQAFDELGNVVGTGVVGGGGGQQAAAQAWGTAGPAPGSTSMVPSSRPARPPWRRSSAWPLVSPFYTGGSGPGTLQPTPFNPCGRADNCGFTSMSYASSLQNPGHPLRDAEQLYFQRLEQLGFPPDATISRQLVFPDMKKNAFEGIPPRPGYEMFFTGDGNNLPDWTLPVTARALGIPGIETNDALQQWSMVFGRHASLDDAVQARVDFLEAHGNQSVDPARVRQWVEGRRAELPGTYIVGSRLKAHYLTITIAPNGQLTGLDPQNLQSLGSFEAVQGRMGESGFDMIYKVTLPLPPGGVVP